MMGDLWYNPTRLFFLLKDCFWYISVMHFVQRMHNTKIFCRQQYHPHKHGCKFSNTLCCCFKLFSGIRRTLTRIPPFLAEAHSVCCESMYAKQCVISEFCPEKDIQKYISVH